MNLIKELNKTMINKKIAKISYKIKKLLKIKNKDILKLKFKNTYLKIVGLKEFNFLVEPRYYFYGWSDLKSCFVRVSVVKKLILAKSYLPKGYNFKIWDGFRRKETQRLLRISFRKRLENLYPDWNSKKISKALNIFTGSPIKKIRLRLRNHFTLY